MPLNFPNNPQVGQTWTDPNSGSVWGYIRLSTGSTGWHRLINQGGGPGSISGSPYDPQTDPFAGSGAGGTTGGAGTQFNFPGIPIQQTSDLGGGNSGGFFDPRGGFHTGSPTGDFGQGGGSKPWYNSFWGQTGINTGLNLLGGYLQNQATGKANKQNQKSIEDRIRQALAALAPEHIMALAQQFLPQMSSQAFGAGQTAIQAVRAQAARTGQLEGPRALSFEAGTRAKLASDVQQKAFEGAMNTAGAQAGAISGAPFNPIQPQMGFAQGVINSANHAYGARFYQQANRQNNTPGTPYRWPGMGSYGNQASYGW